MSNIKLVLQISTPNPRPVKEKIQATSDLLDKIRDYCTAVNIGSSETRYEWDYLKNLYKAIQSKDKLSDLHKCILEMIEPVIMKYAEYDHEFAPTIDGVKLNRHSDKESK